MKITNALTIPNHLGILVYDVDVKERLSAAFLLCPVRGDRGGASSPSKALRSLQLEALAVRALDLGGVGLMGAHGNGVQAAVVGVLTVVGAVVDGALDALVGGAFAAAVGAILHVSFLLREKYWRSAGASVRRKEKSMCV